MTTRDPKQENFLKQEQNAKNRFFAGVILVHAAMYLPEFLLPPFTLYSLSFHWYQLVLFTQIVVNINSFKTQQPDEVGALLLFGKYLYQTAPGLVYAPAMISEWRHESSVLRQFEIPADLPDRYDGAKTIRVTTAPSSTTTTTEANDPLDTGRLTIDGSFVVAAKLDRSPGAFRQFIEHVGSYENFLQMADDLVVNRFSKEVIKRTPSQVFKDWDELDKASKKILKEKIGLFGFDTEKLDVFAKGFDLPHRVNQALADRTKAHVNVETSRLEGLAIKEKDTLVAAGAKALKSAEIDGTIEALVNAKRALGLSSEQALVLAYNEVVGKVLEKAQYTLLPQGRGGMLDPASMMAVMQEAIKTGREGGGS